MPEIGIRIRWQLGCSVECLLFSSSQTQINWGTHARHLKARPYLSHKCKGRRYFFCFRQVSISCYFDNSRCVYLYVLCTYYSHHKSEIISCLYTLCNTILLVSKLHKCFLAPSQHYYVNIVLTVGYNSLALVTGTFRAQLGKLFSREDSRNEITWHFEILMTATM